MTTTEVLASLIGLYFIAGGMAMLTDRKAMTGIIHSLSNQPVLAYLGGAMAFITGGAMLAVHSSWDGVMASIVTLVGWIALIKGVLLIAAREATLKITGKINYDGLTGTVTGAVMVALGALLVITALL